jgi:hypothetical protein
MSIPVRKLPMVICAVVLFSVSLFAQTPERRADSTTQAQEQSPNLTSNANSIDRVANEIGLLRRSVQTLNVRLQIEEDMRSENIERSLNVMGTTRTAELREARRRVFENERRGVQSLLNQNLQNRRQLEEDVKQADVMVSRLRERLFPLIEKEIDKIKPN